MANATQKPALQNSADLLAANLIKVLPSDVKSIPNGSQSMTPTQAVVALQKGSALYTNAAQAKVDYQDAIKLKVAGEPGLRQLVSSLESFVKVMIPTDTAGLASCGIAGKKARVPLTPEEAAAKVAKLRATRAANGTMGTAQKKKAAKAAKTTTIVVGPNGQPIPGSALPPPVVAGPSSNAAPSLTPAAVTKP